MTSDYRREKNNTRVLMSTQSSHMVSEGIEFHSRTGEIGRAVGKLSMVLVTMAAMKMVEVLKDDE